MTTKAYFMVNVDEKFCQDGYQEAVRDLQAMPEVKSVESVSGVCDLLVQVEAPIRVILVANKIMSKEWVKRLYVLKVEPFQPEGVPKPTAPELLKAQTSSPDQEIT